MKLFETNRFMRIYRTFQQQKEIKATSEASQKRKWSFFTQKLAEEEETDCTICMEKIANRMLQCGHAFCPECLDEWRKRNNMVVICPICRHRTEDDFDNLWSLEYTPNYESILKRMRDDILFIVEDPKFLD